VQPPFVRAEIPSENKPYLEASYGFASLSSVETNSYSSNFAVLSVDNVSGKFSFGNNSIFGIEGGLKNISGSKFRIGINYQYSEQNLNSFQATGTLNFNGNNYQLSDYTNAYKLQDLGINIFAANNLFFVNGYYDFENKSAFIPYIGIGVGLANISFMAKLNNDLSIMICCAISPAANGLTP
jgi:opacity protein-like surface antigen